MFSQLKVGVRETSIKPLFNIIVISQPRHRHHPQHPCYRHSIQSDKYDALLLLHTITPRKQLLELSMTRLMNVCMTNGCVFGCAVCMRSNV